MIAFLRQTTNHHTVKNDHKTIDLETRLQKTEPGEIAIKQTMTSNHRIARVHYPVLKPPRTRTETTNGPQADGIPPGTSGKPHATKSRVAVREPKSIPIPLPASPQRNPRSQRSLPHQHAHTTPGTVPGAWATRRTPDRRPEKKLRRKEVIQPHLPVRLPCYDLVPITSLTLDGSPQKVGPPASGATHFHDLTGGVYKARERIHRGVADPRLLATPPSWSRVADSNPN